MRQTFHDQADPSFGTLHLPLIREAVERQGLDGFLIPHEDEHQNEYLPEANDRLAWATGFTGSAGAAVVLKERAVKAAYLSRGFRVKFVIRRDAWVALAMERA